MLRIAAYNIKALMEGGLSLVPGAMRLFRTGTRGTDSARYCYSVWLRHLVKTQPHRVAPFGGRVVELGPGDSLGIGLAALLSGASQYIAVDVVRHASVPHNLRVLDKLVQLFSDRSSIPADDEFPDIRPPLDRYAFPADLFDPASMERNLAPDRIAAIAAALAGEASAWTEDGEPLVRYVDPAAAADIIEPASCDLVFSQAVLEHVDDLPGAYRACLGWLTPAGLMSHQIDFKSHGASPEWNGHWVYPEPIWRLLRGGRPYLINREPCATHLRLLAETGFEVLAVERSHRPSRLRGDQLAARFRTISAADLTTAGAYVIARKKGA